MLPITNQETTNNCIICSPGGIHIFNTFITSKFGFHISSSILRLVSINFIYIFLIKFLLLTTHYEKIIKILIIHIKSVTNNTLQKVSFEIVLAAQFLKIIIQEISALKIAYKIRSIKSQYKYLSRENIFIYWLLIKQVISNIYHHTSDVANMLYSRETTYNSFIIDYQSI